MIKVLVTIAALAVFTSAVAADVRIASVKGDVRIRHGMQDQWTAASAGDALKPEDSILSGEGSAALLEVPGEGRIALPELVIIDISDLRAMSAGDVLLMLAMQDIRAIPDGGAGRDPSPPRTTIVHGTDKSRAGSAPDAGDGGAPLQLNGTKVLYDHGYFASCVLRAKETFRRDPGLLSRIDSRLMVAEALEKLRLPGEALQEYREITGRPLDAAQRSLVDRKITELKKPSGE